MRGRSNRDAIADRTANRGAAFHLRDERRHESYLVLNNLRLPVPTLVERQPDDERLCEIPAAILDIVQPRSTFVLSGKFLSIRYISRLSKNEI